MPISRRLLRPGGGRFTPRRVGNLSLWLDPSVSESSFIDSTGPTTAMTDADFTYFNQINDCVLWVAADNPENVITNGYCFRMKDRSAYNSLVTDTGTILPSNSPTTRQPRVIYNAINGKPAFRFTGTQTMFGNTESFGSAGTAFAVVRVGSDVSGKVFAVNDYTEQVGVQSTGGNALEIDSSLFGNDSALAGFDRFAIVTFINGYVGGVSFLRNNASTISGLGSEIPLNNSSLEVSVGWSSLNAGEYFVGDICEVLVYTAVLELSDCARIEKYLADKYGIPAVHSSTESIRFAAVSPLQIGGCVGWYDAQDAGQMFDNTTVGQGSAVAVNGTVARWMDKSPQQNHLTQATPGSRPTLIGNALNGKQVLRFDGGDGLVGLMAEGPFRYNSYTLFVVTKINSGVNNGRVVSFAPTSGLDYAAGVVIPCVNHAGNANQLSLYSGTTGGNAQVVSGFNAYAIFTGRSSQGSIVNYSNGVAAAAASSITINTTAGQMAVGQPAQGGTGGFNGDIAEVVIYNTALTEFEQRKVERYLAEKYAIAGVSPATPGVGFQKNMASSGFHATQSTAAAQPLSVLDTTTGKQTLDMTAATTASLTSLVTAATYVGSATTSPTVMFAIAYKPFGAGSAFAFGSNTMANSASRVFFSSDFGAAGSHVFDIGSVTGGRLTGTVTDETTDNHVCIAYRNGTTMAVRRDGVQLLTLYGASGGFTSTTGNLVINSPEGGTGRAYYHEFLAYANVPTLDKITALEKYLATKWQATLAPAVGNVEAQDWINRVYLAGSTVSSSTASAVNEFCNTVDSIAGLRESFFRLNLFCGGTSGTAAGLTACLVPLYRNWKYWSGRNANKHGDPNRWASKDTVTTTLSDTERPFSYGPYAHRVQAQAGTGVTPNVATAADFQVYGTTTTSLYLKADGKNVVRLFLSGGGGMTWGGISYTACDINLTNGAVSGTGASATSLGNGWWRLAFTTTNNSVGYFAVRIDVGNGAAYNSTTSDAILVWGVQCEPGSVANEYEPYPIGGLVDTNTGNGTSFQSADYIETGVQGGLKGAANKLVKFGLKTSALPRISTGHLAVYTEPAVGTSGTFALLSSFSDGFVSTNSYYLQGSDPYFNTIQSSWGHLASAGPVRSTGDAGAIITSRQGQTTYKVFANATQVGSTDASSVTPAVNDGEGFAAFCSFAGNTSGTGNNGLNYHTGRIKGYSIGQGLTDAQVAAYTTALSNFQTALGRQYPTVSNIDARDWVDRVYANGGSVSVATANAVNAFCESVASIRSKFYRFNPFCGNLGSSIQTSGVVVPLFRGPSVSDTYGNLTDTQNGFSTSNYSEADGLLGAVNRYLATGLSPDTVGVSTGHVSIWAKADTASSAALAIGSRNSDASQRYEISTANRNAFQGGGITDFYATQAWGGTIGQAYQTTGSAARPGGMYLATRTSGTRIDFYLNASSVANSTASVTPGANSNQFYVQAINSNGTATFTGAATCRGYSIGLSLDITEVALLYSAWSVLQTALGR